MYPAMVLFDQNPNSKNLVSIAVSLYFLISIRQLCTGSNICHRVKLSLSLFLNEHNQPSLMSLEVPSRTWFQGQNHNPTTFADSFRSLSDVLAMLLLQGKNINAVSVMGCIDPSFYFSRIVPPSSIYRTSIYTISHYDVFVKKKQEIFLGFLLAPFVK